MEGKHKVVEDRPEPPGWLKLDETLDAVYRNNIAVPGIFLFWYAGVQLFKQIGRLIWIAGWKLRRRRLRQPPRQSVQGRASAVALKPGAARKWRDGSQQ